MARQSPVRYPELDFSGLDLNEEITPVRVAADDVMYVALGKDLKENERNLKWAIQKSAGTKICMLHVHSPALKIPIMGTKFCIDQLAAQSVRAYHENERRDMQKILEKYVLICARAGVRADTLVIEKDSIERGIVELISQHGIEKLIMGAAANKCYSKKMTGLKSKKAIYVRLQAPTFCCIWFVCKGNLIYTRERESERPDPNSLLLSIPVSPDTDILLRSRSATEGFNEQVDLRGSFTEYPRVVSDNHRINFSGLSSGRTLQANFASMSSDRSSDGTPRGSPSVASHLSSSSSVEMVGDSPATSVARTEGNDTVADSYKLHRINLDHQSSPPSIEENLDGEPDELYDILMKYVAEAEKARREAFEESIKRRKAEKDAIEARRRVKESETIYADELRQRREIEEALAKGKEEAARVKSQLKKIKEDLQAAEVEKSLLEAQLQNSDTAVQELEQKMFSAVDLLQKYRKERDELEAERDDVLKSAEALREQHSSGSSNTSPSVLFADFYFYEIEDATRNFDPALKIGEGGYGSIYKGFLRHTQVAIKMLHPNSLQGPSEFQQEVNILSKLRHPNIVTLIGACPEAWTLVYEYLPNGSLEDRLNCKDNTPPLSWQTRIRIATELCCALIFLHSCTARGIIHGDLKPANILLDANFVSKLSDFGICRVLSEDDSSDNSTTLCHRTDPKGTFAYMDPEFLQTGELTPKSDVYSFGIILLRLLTGRPAMGITREIQYALDKGNLKDLLDPTAGDWPFVQAKQLAHLAMGCCERNRSSRPNLSSEVWKVLEPMRASCGTSSFRLNSDERCDIPSYFICPIFQEVMQDPVIAADGFTYEAEALRGWLDSGHDTSPMTNLALEHKNLVPNHALRSAIQEWLQQH